MASALKVEAELDYMWGQPCFMRPSGSTKHAALAAWKRAFVADPLRPDANEPRPTDEELERYCRSRVEEPGMRHFPSTGDIKQSIFGRWHASEPLPPPLTAADKARIRERCSLWAEVMQRAADEHSPARRFVNELVAVNGGSPDPSRAGAGDDGMAPLLTEVLVRQLFPVMAHSCGWRPLAETAASVSAPDPIDVVMTQAESDAALGIEEDIF